MRVSPDTDGADVASSAAASKNFPEKFSEKRVQFSDGLGPMHRWERDRILPETVSILVQRVAEGERLKLICKSRGWPYALVAQWVAETPEVFRAYEKALMLAADDLGLETVDISDEQALAVSKRGVEFDPDVARDTLRVKARQWAASRLYRERYGEKVEVSGEVRHTHSLIGILSGMTAHAPEELVTERVIESLPEPSKEQDPI